MHASGFLAYVSQLSRKLGRLLAGSSSRRPHEDLIPQLFVRRLEDRCVLNAHATPLSALAGVLVVNASQPSAADHGESITLTHQGNQLDIAVDGKQIAAASLDKADTFEIVGDGQQDTFTLTINSPDNRANSAAAISIENIQWHSPLNLTVYAAAGDTVSIGGTSNLDGGNLKVSGGSIRFDGKLTSRGGSVVLDAGEQGTLTDYGTIDVSNPAAGAQGGTVDLLGNQVNLLGQARVDASGDGGGGTVLVGGDSHGANPEVRDASFTFVGPNVQVAADALNNGDGGRIVVWSNEATVVQGRLSAVGGSSGNGGFVETSSDISLDVSSAHITASAEHGAAGTWLLDPWNVTITSGSTTSGSFAAGVYTPIATGATVSSAEIVNELNAGTNVTITTGSTGGEAGDISVNSAILWKSSATLTFDAAGSVFVNSTIANKGSGGLELDAGDSVNIAAPINMAGDVTVNAANGGIFETGGGTISAAGLTTNSATGTVLTGNNMIAEFQAANTTIGDVYLIDDSPLLTVTGITESGGNIRVDDFGGAISITGLMTAGPGGVLLACAGSLTESGGAIDGNGLATNSAGGTVLGGPNTIQSVSGHNVTAGDYEVNDNTASLVVIGISEDGGGNVRISNAGSVDIAQTVSAGSGNVTLAGGGMVTQESFGNIVAAGLELLGDADFTLSDSNNLVAKLAGDTTGSVAYHNAGSLSIDTVNTVGLTAANKPIDLTADGGIAVDAILTGSSIDLTAAGQITENGGAIDGSMLTTDSVGGTELTGPNSVQSLNGTNSAGGDFDFGDSTPTLVVVGVNQADDGNIRLTNSSSMNIEGPVATRSGNITLSASGSAIESGLGKVAGTGLELLGSADFTLTNADNLVANLAGNTTGSVAYHNAGDLSIATVNSVGLTAANKSIELTADGSISVNATLEGGSIALTAAGQITESGGEIDGSTLTTVSVGGTELAGPNSVQSLNGTNSGGGDFDFGDTMPTLLVTGVEQVDGGNIRLSNDGSINLAGTITTPSGNVTLSGSGSVLEGSLGRIVAAGLELLGSADFTLTNADNLVTDLAGNTTGKVAYHNAGNLSIATVNSTGLTTGTGSIELTADGSISVLARISGGSVEITPQDEIVFDVASGTAVLTSGGQTYNGPVELLADTALASTAAGDIRFAATVDGAFALNVESAGSQIFTGIVGGAAPLTSLSADAAHPSGSIHFNMAINPGNAAGLTAGSITIGGTTFLDIANGTTSHPSVKTSGDQTYNGPVQMLADTALASTAAGDIQFAATLDGAFALNVESAGSLVFGGGVGGTSPLTSLSADAAHPSGSIHFNMTAGPVGQAGVTASVLTLDGTTFINVADSTTNSPSIKTSGGQIYNSSVQLLLDTVLVTTSGGNVTMNSTVDSGTPPAALTISADGKILFADNVGATGPLRSVTSVVNQGVTIAQGKSINTVTGAASSDPPVLFVLQTTPQQEQVFPSNLTQTVYGYIGFAGAPSGYTELGQNYNIEVLWNDGSVTMSDTQSLATARPSPGFGSFVGYGTVATMSSVPGSPGVWTYNNTGAVLPSFLPAAPANGITFAISHTYDINFVSSLGRSSLTAVMKLVNTSSIVLSNPALDGNIATGAPPSAASLNAVQTSTTVPVTSGLVGVPTPAPFAPPAAVAPREIASVPAVASTPPVQSVNATDEFNPREEKIATERRMIEIVKRDPDGNPEKEVILTDVPEKLNELLAKLKQGAYRNGRYAVYLTEYSSTGNTVIGRRLLMEVYKSGHTLGDPVHEPGPSSNPLPLGDSDQKTPEAPKAPAHHDAASPAKDAIPVTLPASQPALGRTIEARSASERGNHGSIARRASIATAAAVAVIGGRASHSIDDWANRVDQVLGENQLKKLRRMAWLARARKGTK